MRIKESIIQTAKNIIKHTIWSRCEHFFPIFHLEDSLCSQALSGKDPSNGSKFEVQA